MSAAIPYVAPWQTVFERFSTQVIPFTKVSSIAETVTIPDQQWWRVVYISAFMQAQPPVANRTVELDVLNDDGVIVQQIQTPLQQKASEFASYLFGPGVSAMSNEFPLATSYGASAIPDMILPGGYKFNLLINNAQAGDAFVDPLSIAFELYHEAIPGVFVPAAPPLLT